MVLGNRAEGTAVSEVPGYCGLCAVGCPTVSRVEGARIIEVRPDPTHPFGGHICAKGRATPEMHDHTDRVNFPLRRTRPKGDPDPGWERCSWDDALDTIAQKLLTVREESGAQAVAFNKGTNGGTGLTDAEGWINRLATLFGTPNMVGTTHLCQWPRDTGGAAYTFGTPRLAMPDIAHSGCVLLWGANASANFLSLGTDIARATSRGTKLLVVDPRRIGLANKADVLLQVRPGTDGALALSLIHLLIENEWFDKAFVSQWTNAPLLVRDDNGQLLQAEEVCEADVGGTASQGYLACQDISGDLVDYDPANGVYAADSRGLALRGARRVRLADGQDVTCRPVLDRLAAIAQDFCPEAAAAITGVPAEQIQAAARLLVENRPVSHYFHNGLVQHTNATQAARAIEVLYALLGDFDRPGGNVSAPGPRVNGIQGRGLPQDMSRLRLGRAERPAGPPAKPGSVTAYDLYQAILEEKPYPVRAVLSFGSNMLLANGDTLRGRAALQKLEFFAQVELWHTPTSAFADILLPATSYAESAALKLGFRYPLEAMSHVQRRPVVVQPLYQRRSDVQIVLDLGCRLGLSDDFWGGDMAAAYNYVLEPAGLTWEQLGNMPHGVTLPASSLRHGKYAEVDPATGVAKGFKTPTRKVELYSTLLGEHGYPALPEYVEPAWSPVSTPDIAREYPLVLTNAKKAQYLHSQHRGLPSLRKTAPDPTAEIHSTTAGQYGVLDGEWLAIETPHGSARARAHVTDYIVPGVVCANHGWWEGCADLGIAPLDPFSAEGANVNLLVSNDRRDPVSGGTPHRSSLCRLKKLAAQPVAG